MRWNGFPIIIALALAGASAPALAAGFGTVVPIGGHASDIALAESRSTLYIANFTANRIEMMSTADNSIRGSINVSSQPGALAVSRDGQYLVVTHYGNWITNDPTRNQVTVINLSSNARQTFVTGEPALGVAFVAGGKAVIVTSSSILVLDPATGVMQVVSTFSQLASEELPAEPVTFPSEIM